MHRETDWKKIIDDLKTFSCVASRNALNQSECRTFESTVFQVKIDESTWFLACRYKFKKLKNDVYKFLVRLCSTN